MKDFWALAGFEYKKLLKRRLVWIVTVVCLVSCAFSGSVGVFGDHYVDGQVYESHLEKQRKEIAYERELSGRAVDDALLKEMQDSFAKAETNDGLVWASESYQKYGRPYEGIMFYIVDMTGKKNVYKTVTEEQLYEMRMEKQKDSWISNQLTEGEMDYWAGKEEQLEKPLIYQYCGSYREILSLMATIGFLMTLWIAVCIPGIFTEEHLRKTDQLILCTKLGKKRLYGAKVFVSITGSLLILLLMCIVIFTTLFLVYGIDGFNAQMQMYYQDGAWWFSVGQAVLIMILVAAAVTLIQNVFSVFIAEFSGSSIAAMAVLVGIMIFTMIFNMPGQYRVLSQIWDSLPNNILYTWNLFSVRLIPVFGNYLTEWQLVPVIYVVLAVILVAICYRKYKNYQVGGR